MRPSSGSTIWATVRTFSSSQYGSEITAGPAKWGFFDGSYISGDNGVTGGWNHVASSSGVNELQLGIRRATEAFGTQTDADLNRILKSTVGYTLPQFHPELNTLGTIPQVTFGLATTGTTSPDFTYDSRMGSTAHDWLGDVQDTFTWTRGKHTLKLGGYFEYMQNNEARGGNWYGQYTFSNTSTNPLNTNFAFSNAVLGVFSQYTETDKYRLTQNRQWWSEWYGQDTWQLNDRMTFDYGVRFLLYSPYYRPDNQVANFDPSRYDPSQAPRLYYPATVNGTRVGLDRTTGQTVNQIYIGTFVPGTGNPANGMVLQADAGVPKGFREIEPPQPEPRLGFTWDLTGAGKTVLHSSAGLFHQARLGGGSLGNLAANPPFIHNPVVFNGSFESLFAPGVTLSDRPGTVEALETAYKTPSSYNWSIGLRREIGLGDDGGRDVHRVSRAQHGDVQRPQRGARRRAQPDSASGEPRPDWQCHDRAVGRLPPAVPWLRINQGPRELGNGRLARVAGSGQSPLHPRRPVRRRVHAAAGPRVCGRGSRQPLDFAQPSRELGLQRARAEQSSESRRQLHVGFAGRRARRLQQSGRSRPARLLKTPRPPAGRSHQ